jgi:outer membrane protein OmpA-like peptidoglycan-associated protein
MKNKILIVTALLITIFASGQSYFGYLNDNYAGVHSVINNPSNIADSRFKTDINLVSFSGFIGNDLYATKITNFFKSDYNFERDGTKTPKESNNFINNADVLGLSFMFNLSEKSALALFSRGRSISHISNINGKSLDDINNTMNTSYTVREQNYSLATNAWGEFGISYAQIISDKNQHFLKGGLSLKYLYGVYSGFVKAKNINLSYNYTGNPNTSTTTTSGELETGNVKSLDNFNDPFDNKGSGFGADLGLTYEYRPDFQKYKYKNKQGGQSYFKDKNKYKYRLQFSVTDIGSINYKDATITRYRANAIYTDTQYNNNPDFSNLYTKIEENKSVVFNLPTAIHLNADWKMNNTFYLNLNTDLSLINPDNSNSGYINNNLSLTPRLEVKWFSVYTPVTYLQYSGLQAGFGLRAGPLFVGSGSIISGMLSETKAVDVHVGLKIPVYQGKLKDIDFDGIKDKDDKCLDIAGPIENKGCPWGDEDKDGITDDIDKCPKEFGPKQNKGCPWPDKDGDSVLDKDDKCPTVAGAIENKGCPWGDQDKDGVTDNVDNCPTESGMADNNGCPYKDSDGDTILDKDDKCPDVKGTVENKGCPKAEIDSVGLKKLSQYSSSVLFDTGKSNINFNDTTTATSLKALVQIMNEYPTTNFSIEGHTDNVGKPESNFKLSSDRALAIKNYLIENGVAESRLQSQGFGSTKPLSDKKTKQAISANRRVEIKVVD